MDLHEYLNNYESDSDCRDNIKMIKSELNEKDIVKNYTIYEVRHKNKDFNDKYIGLTHNFAVQKTQHKSNIKNPRIKTKLIERIRNTGGWDEWLMIELEQMFGSKEDVKIRQQEYIKELNANLNVRNPVKQHACKIKNKIKLVSDKKKEKLNNKMNMHVDTNVENAKERKNQFIEKNKEKRQSLMNKNRELKKFIIEDKEDDEEKEEDENKEVKEQNDYLRRNSEKKAEEETKKPKKKKQSIPKNIRMIVWNHYIGEDIIKHKCLCCKKVTISNTNFEVGHVLSEKNGGTLEINNLRPICFACNHSMGAENMIHFVVKFGLYIG
jgi:5-methylcytosine-specific restriction endonuclease McrA